MTSDISARGRSYAPPRSAALRRRNLRAGAGDPHSHTSSHSPPETAALWKKRSKETLAWFHYLLKTGDSQPTTSSLPKSANRHASASSAGLRWRLSWALSRCWGWGGRRIHLGR